MTNQVYLNDHRHQELTQKYDKHTPQETTLMGRSVDKVAYESEAKGFFNRVGKLAKGVFTLDGKSAKLGATGHATKEVLYARTEPPRQAQAAAHMQKLGYDPQNRKSVSEYAESHKSKFRAIKGTGHLVLEETRRKGVSSFIFVPNGDFSKAKSIKLWNSKTGESLTGADFWRALQDYSLLYDDIKSAWKEQSNKIAASLTKQHEKEYKPEKIRKRMGSIVIDPRSKEVRILSKNIDINRRQHKSTTGTAIKIPKDRWKEVIANHGKHTSQYKKDVVPEEKPFDTNDPRESEIRKGKEKANDDNMGDLLSKLSPDQQKIEERDESQLFPASGPKIEVLDEEPQPSTSTSGK